MKNSSNSRLGERFLALIIPIMMGFNFVVIEISGLHLYMSLLLTIAAISCFSMFVVCQKRLYHNKEYFGVIILFMWIFFVLITAFHGQPTSLVNLILFSLFSLLCFLFNRTINFYNDIFRAIILGTIIVIVRVLLFYEGASEIDIHSRFNMDFLGGVNNSAYVVSFAILCTYYFVNNKVLKIILIIAFVTFNIYTLSRGANLALLVVFTYIVWMKGVKMKILLLSMLLVGVSVGYFFLDEQILDRFSFSNNSQSSGDNRSMVWIYALSQMNSITSLLLGKGTGSFEMYLPENLNSLLSTHNQYIDFIYGFGIIGSIPFLGVYLIYLKKVYKIRKQYEFAFLANILFAISFIFDSRLWIIQTVWLFPLLVSYSFHCLKSIRCLYN